MPLTLGLNLSSLRAQTQLSKTSSELSSVFERLSSGQRINRASDDAAGLAVAESLNADARVYTQGVRNLNDGISVLNIADGAIQELTNITFRLTELAEQAANGTFGAAQRASLNEEAQALKAEYFRIAKSTEFNGRKLFEGDYGVLSLQAGYGTAGSLSDGLGGDIGTGEFSSEIESTLVKQANSIVYADVNGDSNLDAIYSSVNDETVNVMFGNGSGSFSAEQSYTVSTDPQQVIAEDVNNDGHLDLLTASAADDNISVLLGDGSGSFGAAQTFSTTADPVGLTTADFNGDGILDLAAANSGGDGVTVHLGVGDGTFGAATSYGSGFGGITVNTGDFNNDGIEDIVYGASAGVNVNILLGNGDGTFQADIVGNSGILSPRGVQVADFNQDGNFDAIVADVGGNGFSVMLGNGDGTLQNGVAYNTASVEFNVAVGDFNGDGIVDFAGSTLGGIYVYEGVGDGTFGTGVQYEASSGFFSLSAADVDNDGVVDLLAHKSPASISVLLGETVDGVAPLLDFSLTTIADAKQALSQFQHKLDHLSSQRGQIGAFQSRIEVAERVLSVSVENFKAAESRIRDADIAQETAKLVRLQILQQAGAAILGQANQQPQLVLQLLRNEN